MDGENARPDLRPALVTSTRAAGSSKARVRVLWAKLLTALFGIGLVACIVGAEVLILTIPQNNQSDRQQGTGEASDKQQGCRPVPDLSFAWVPIRTRLCVAAFKNIRFFDAYHDTINAVSTLLVAVFTFTLWRSTRCLYVAGERQLAVVEENAASQNSANEKTLAIAASGVS